MKREAMQILFKCAQIYNENLLNKNLLIVTSCKNKIDFLEIKFPKSAYLHLTGVELNKKLSANLFYKLCYKRRLSLTDFEFKSDGTTRLKLEVLPMLLNINSSVKMINIYNGQRPKLFTEKLAGNIKACLGLIKSDDGNFYVPNTVLKTDMRDEGIEPEKVLFMMKKNNTDLYYENITYTCKDFDFDNFKIPKNLSNKLKINNQIRTS